MSTTDGDAATELSPDDTEVIPKLPPRDASTATEPNDVWNVDGPDDDEPDVPIEVPDIVPATDPAADDEVRGALLQPDGPAPESKPVVPKPDHPTTRVVAPPPAAFAPVGASAATSSIPTVAPSVGSGSTTGWSDHMAPLTTGAAGSPLRAPGRRPRVRRVTRVLRHIDPWSTFKVALLFSMVAYLVALTSGVLLWRVADSTGTLDNVERWFTQFGWETFELQGGEIFRNAWIIGLFGAVALTGALVLLATLFNLVSDIIGGIRLTVLEEEVVEKTASSARRYVVRRAPAAGAASEQWGIDDDDPGQSDHDADSSAAAITTTTDATAGSPNGDWSVDDADDGVDQADSQRADAVEDRPGGG